METSHENSRFRSQLLEKTIVLNPSLLARLKSQFLPSATATVATFATVEPSKHSHTKIGTTVLLVALLATCTSPSYANNVKVQQRVNTNNSKVYIRVNGEVQGRVKASITVFSLLLASCQPSYAEVGKSLCSNSSLLKIQEVDSSLNRLKTQLSEKISQNGNYGFLTQLNKINQLSFFDSFNCIAKVAVTGNNLKQELRNLFKSVQHHTIVGVFLCLSFNNLSFTGKLYLALALVRFWQGGRGNKPFIGRIPCAVDLAVSNLLAALHLGQSSKKLPFEKV